MDNNVMIHRLPTLASNLSPERVDLLNGDLALLSPERVTGPVGVYDLSAPEVPSSAAAATIEPAPPPPAGPPVTINDRWAWDRRRQSFQILGDPARPVIVGGGLEGAMYGFYRWLQDQGGCRWYTLSDAEHLAGIPPRPLPEGVVTPAIAWRGFEGTLARWQTPFLRRLMRWMLRNGWNLLLFNAGDWAARADRAAIGRLAERHGIRLVIGGHAAEHFLPPSLFAPHPEYFGLRNGTRCRHTTTVYPDMPGRILKLPAQPCYGNPRTRRFLARRIADFMDATPEMTAFSLWPHDGSNNWCECPDCVCDTPYRLMHDLAREILARTRRPVPVELLAYGNLLTPPETDLAPEPRVYTLFCPYLRPHRHCFDAAGFPPECQTLGRGWPAPQPINPVDDREYGRLYQRWLPIGFGIDPRMSHAKKTKDRQPRRNPRQ